MNKKGFTLVEILAVIVILSLIITIVATNGFGAFNRSKEKINELNQKAINEAAELVKVEIEYCDDELSEDLLDMFGKIDCTSLKQSIKNGDAQVTLDKMIENGFIEGNSMRELSEKEIYTLTFEEVNNKISYNTSSVTKFAMIEEFSYANRTKYYASEYKNNIVEVAFVDYVDLTDAIIYWNIETSDSTVPIYAWIVERPIDGKYMLYIGSETTIYANTKTNYLFSEFINLTTINFGNFNTSKSEDMTGMFYGCSSLTSLDLSGFNTSMVSNMSNMFYGCSSLINLNLKGFDTSEVTLMGRMFEGCSSLTEIDLSSFNTSKVTYMLNMFCGCSSLTKLDLKRFDTSNVTMMGGMFEGCSSLLEVDLSSFKTSKVTYMSSMFEGCSSLTKLNLLNFTAEKIENINEMFKDCSSLTEIDLRNFNTTYRFKKMNYMFENCNSLVKVNLQKIYTGGMTDNPYRVFRNCINLKEICFDTSRASRIIKPNYTEIKCS